MRAGRCPKCRGNLYFEADVVERLVLRKCLQCGLIESYFWLERSTRTLVYLPVERDLPVHGDYA
jgi:predicted nucleic-acid-binding Zn-ribbon protein